MTSTTTAKEQAQKLGDYLRQARERKGFSLRQLDQATGVSANYIWLVEKPTGKETPRIGAEVLGKLADALDLNLDDLFVAVGWRKSKGGGPRTDAVIANLTGRPELKELLLAAKDLRPEMVQMLTTTAQQQLKLTKKLISSRR